MRTKNGGKSHRIRGEGGAYKWKAKFASSMQKSYNNIKYIEEC